MTYIMVSSYLSESCVMGTVLLGVQVVRSHTGSVARVPSSTTTTYLAVMHDQPGKLGPVTSGGRKYVLTTALWIDAYQAIHGENKNKSFFGSFSVNEMRMKRDSWIGVLRQIRKGDDIP
jgi:hypothetical protein